MTSRKLHEAWGNFLGKCVLDCIYSPFLKITCILTFPPTSLEQFLWGAFSWAAVLILPPNKIYLVTLTLCIFLSQHWSSQFSWVQSLIHVRLFATPWTAARQASLSITNSRSLLTLVSIESVMPPAVSPSVSSSPLMFYVIESWRHGMVVWPAWGRSLLCLSILQTGYTLSRNTDLLAMTALLSAVAGICQSKLRFYLLSVRIRQNATGVERAEAEPCGGDRGHPKALQRPHHSPTPTRPPFQRLWVVLVSWASRGFSRSKLAWCLYSFARTAITKDHRLRA